MANKLKVLIGAVLLTAIINTPYRHFIDHTGVAHAPSLLTKLFPFLDASYEAFFIKSIQPGNCDVGTTGACNVTLGTAVTILNTIISLSGYTDSAAGTATYNCPTCYTANLSSTTNVALAELNSSGNAASGYIVATEFYPQVFTTRGVQRNLTDITGSNSKDVTISSVGSGAVPLSCGMNQSSSNSSWAKSATALTLTTTTNLNIARTTSVAATFNQCWQVPDWRKAP